MHILLHMKAIERSEVLRSSSPVLTGLQLEGRHQRDQALMSVLSELNGGPHAFPSSFDLLSLVIILIIIIIITPEYGQLGDITGWDLNLLKQLDHQLKHLNYFSNEGQLVIGFCPGIQLEFLSKLSKQATLLIL